MAKRTDAVYQGVYEPFLNPRKNAGTTQQQIQWMLERTLLELAMNRFEWKGLPPEIDKRWLEMSLMFHGLSVYFFDSQYQKFFAMPGAGAGPLNLYGNPTEFIVYGNQYYTKRLNAEDVVPIWANYSRVPDMDKILIYARRMAQMDRTIEINSLNARRTKVLAMTENGRITVENANKQINEGSPSIAIANGFDPAAFGTIDLGVDPNSIVNMHILRSREWNEVMTLLGINNANQDKKERLVAAEVSGNDDMVAAIRATNLNARRIACDAINDMWAGYTVSVDYVTDMSTPELTDKSQQGTAIEEGSAA